MPLFHLRYFPSHLSAVLSNRGWIMLSVLGPIFYSTYSTHFFRSNFHFFTYYHFCTNSLLQCLLHSHSDGVTTVMKNTALDWVCQHMHTVRGEKQTDNEKCPHLALLPQGAAYWTSSVIAFILHICKTNTLLIFSMLRCT